MNRCPSKGVRCRVWSDRRSRENTSAASGPPVRTRRLQQRRDVWPVRRPDTYVVDAHDSLRIDQHVSTQLMDIAARSYEATAAPQELQVDSEGRRAEDVPPGPPIHPIRLVEPPVLIDQKGPRESGFADIGHGERPGIERHHADPHVLLGKLFLLLSQLRQVLTAWQSPKMAVEDQQQPVAPIVVQVVRVSLSVDQGEPYGQTALSGLHVRLPRSRRPRNVARAHGDRAAAGQVGQRPCRRRVMLCCTMGQIASMDGLRDATATFCEGGLSTPRMWGER